MKPKSNSPADVAAYLKRNNAKLVIGVTRLLTYAPEYRGKVNLGKAVFAMGDNSRAARPVDSAERLGLIEGRQDIGRGNCYIYNVTQHGRDVLAELDRKS